MMKSPNKKFMFPVFYKALVLQQIGATKETKTKKQTPDSFQERFLKALV